MGRTALWSDPPDSATLAAVEVPAGLDIVWQRERRLDDLPVEVGHVQPGARPVGQEDGAEPRVGRRQEFALLVMPFRSICRTRGHEHVPVYQVVGRVADEGVPSVI